MSAFSLNCNKPFCSPFPQNVLKLCLLLCRDNCIAMFCYPCRRRKMRAVLFSSSFAFRQFLFLFFPSKLYDCSADYGKVIVRYGILYISYNTLPGANCARVKYRWNSNSISSIIVPDWTCEASLSRTKIIRLMRELWKSHSHEGKSRPRGV